MCWQFLENEVIFSDFIPVSAIFVTELLKAFLRGFDRASLQARPKDLRLQRLQQI